MVRKIFRILDSQKKLEFHPCETNLTIGGCLVSSFRPPFWFCIHFVGLPQPFVVHQSWSVQPTDSVQYQVLYIQPNYVSILSLLSQLRIFADDKKQLLSILKYTSNPCLKIHLANKYLKPIKRLHFRYLSRVLHLGSALRDTTKNTPAKSQKKISPSNPKKKKKTHFGFIADLHRLLKKDHPNPKSKSHATINDTATKWMREFVVGKIQIEAPSPPRGFRSERDKSPLNSNDGVKWLKPAVGIGKSFAGWYFWWPKLMGFIG